MLYASEAQRRFFQYALSQGKISQDVIDEYDKASKGIKLPERLHAKKKRDLKKLAIWGAIKSVGGRLASIPKHVGRYFKNTKYLQGLKSLRTMKPGTGVASPLSRHTLEGVSSQATRATKASGVPSLRSTLDKRIVGAERLVKGTKQDLAKGLIIGAGGAYAGYSGIKAMRNMSKAAAQLLESNPQRPTKDLITPEISSGNKKLREGIKVNKITTDQTKFTKKVRNLPMGVEKLGQKLKRLLNPKDYQDLLLEKKKLDEKRKGALAETAAIDKDDLKKMSSVKSANVFKAGFIDALKKLAKKGEQELEEDRDKLRKNRITENPHYTAAKKTIGSAGRFITDKAKNLSSSISRAYSTYGRSGIVAADPPDKAKRKKILKDFLRDKEPIIARRRKAKARADTNRSRQEIMARHFQRKHRLMEAPSQAAKIKTNKELESKRVERVAKLKREQIRLRGKDGDNPNYAAAKKTVKQMVSNAGSTYLGAARSVKSYVGDTYNKYMKPGKASASATARSASKLQPTKKQAIKTKPVSADKKSISIQKKPSSKIERAKVNLIKLIKPKTPTKVAPKIKPTQKPSLKQRIKNYKGPGDTYYMDKVKDMKIAPLKDSGGVGSYKAKSPSPSTKSSKPTRHSTKLAAMFELGFLNELNKLAGKIKGAIKLVKKVVNAPRGGLATALAKAKAAKSATGEAMKRSISAPSGGVSTALAKAKARALELAKTKRSTTLSKFMKSRGTPRAGITSRLKDVKATPGADLSAPKMPVIKPTMNRPIGPAKKPKMYYPLKTLR